MIEHNLTFHETFETPYAQYSDRRGQPFHVIGIIVETDDEHDEGMLPMFRIRFADGFEIDAWPEEVTVNG
jgi:hypothetical protein